MFSLFKSFGVFWSFTRNWYLIKLHQIFISYLKISFDFHWSWCSLFEDWIICISINIYLVSVFSMKYVWFIRDGCLYFVLIIGCYWKDEFHWFCRWLRTLLEQTLDCQQGLCWAAINGGESSPLLFIYSSLHWLKHAIVQAREILSRHWKVSHSEPAKAQFRFLTSIGFI